MTEKKTVPLRFLRLTALMLAALLLADAAAFLRDWRSVCSDYLRLHVIAASDSAEDQRLKLAVRDEVLRAGAALFDGSVCAADARDRILPEKERLIAAAEAVLRKNGCRDAVKLSVTREYFPERSYESITLPPGIYEAVKVTVGEGKGHNWWCVMFPPLCLPAADGDAEALITEAGGAEFLTRPEKYEIRFRLAELLGKALEKLRRKSSSETGTEAGASR